MPTPTTLKTTPAVLTAGGIELDLEPSVFGWLRESQDLLEDMDALRARMEEDGYLFLPGFFDRSSVREVRRRICAVLAEDGLLDPEFPVEEARARPGIELYFRPDIAIHPTVRPALESVIYGDRMMRFFDAFFDEPARHYDFTWLRTLAPGLGTSPHCDVVYMGRGTQNVVTAWVPFGDVPLEVGGLIVVEGSHHDEELRRGYCTLDVDTECTNRCSESELNANGYPGFGALSMDMRRTRHQLQRRLLTCPNYQMGDLLLFSIHTVHGSLDNPSREIRISSDSRYQRASEPADERWIGENPPGHGGAMIKGMIC